MNPPNQLSQLDESTAANLAELGKHADSPDDSRNSAMERLRSNPFLVSRSPDLSFPALGTVEWSEAFNIIKGLTLAEIAGISNYCGSVSLVKYAYRVLEDRDPVKAMEVAAWIVDHSDNDYIPFPMRKFRYAFDNIKKTATSWTECRQRLSEWEAKEWARQIDASRSGDEQAAQAEERDRIVKAVKARCHDERQQLSAARARVRMTFLNELSGLDDKSRIEHLAWDDSRDLSYYPDDFAQVSPVTYDSLDSESQARLLAKLQDRPKGAWRTLFRQIDPKTRISK